MASRLVGKRVYNDMGGLFCTCSTFSTRPANLVCYCFGAPGHTLAPSGYTRRRVHVVIASKLHLGNFGGGQETNFGF